MTPSLKDMREAEEIVKRLEERGYPLWKKGELKRIATVIVQALAKREQEVRAELKAKRTVEAESVVRQWITCGYIINFPVSSRAKQKAIEDRMVRPDMEILIQLIDEALRDKECEVWRDAKKAVSKNGFSISGDHSDCDEEKQKEHDCRFNEGRELGKYDAFDSLISAAKNKGIEIV